MDEILSRAEAAFLLDKFFALADLKGLNLPAYETTPRNLGYQATNAAIVAANVIPAAKDSIQFDEAREIENVVNAELLPLAEDRLSFRPAEPITVREFAESLARALVGPDLKLNHMEETLARGYLSEELLSYELLTREVAEEILACLKEKVSLISIFVTSDIHGNWQPYRSSDAIFEIGSVSRMQTIIKQIKAELGEERVLFLDGGDSPYNTTLANITKGDASTGILSAMSLDATVLGNHDFDMSFDNLLRLAREANYPMLSANIRYKDKFIPEGQSDNKIKEFPAYLLIEKAGIRFGIFGVTDHRSAEGTLFSNTQQICFEDHFKVAAETVLDLQREGVDYIIALSHLHADNAKLMEEVPGIDLSIAGGNDIAGKPDIYHGRRYLINPGKHAEALTQVNLLFYEGRHCSVIVNQLFVNEAYEEDAELNELIDVYTKQVDKILDQPIGYLAQNLEWSAQLVREQNSPLANMVSDSLLEFFRADGAEISLFNGGGIRASIDEGEVSMRELTSALPFDNEIMLVEMTGEVLWQAVENGIRNWPGNGGQFLQPAGFTYKFQAGQPNKLLSITLPDGSPLDLKARYKVVINSFMAGGGNGYEMLNILNPEMEKAKDVKLILLPMNLYIRDATKDYLERYSSSEKPLVVNLTENRIEIIK